MAVGPRCVFVRRRRPDYGTGFGVYRLQRRGWNSSIGLPDGSSRNELGAARSAHDLIGAEPHAGRSQPLDLRREIRDLEMDAVPAARHLTPAVGERALSGAAFSAQQEPHTVA